MPDSTHLIEPEVIARTRGRPSMKLENSTRRDPSAFELVPSAQDSYSPKSVTMTDVKNKERMECKPKKIGKIRAIRTRSKNINNYMLSFPVGLRPYIQVVKDVAADGNCGFRVITGLVGLSEDEWRQVRRDLLQELLGHVDHYNQLFGVENIVEELVETLSYMDDCPSIDYWMTMPDIGHLIASRYNLVLYHLSIDQCLTFLPLRSVPVPMPARTERTIGFINRNHFVQLFLTPGHPIPPIANKWTQFHRSCANGWETPYLDRIVRFKELVSPNVSTAETIDLD